MSSEYDYDMNTCTHTHTHIALLQPLCRSTWVSWLPLDSQSSVTLPHHLHRTGPNSSYQRGTLVCIPPTNINCHPKGFEADVFIGHVPFLLPNQQHQSTEGKNVTVNTVR